MCYVRSDHRLKSDINCLPYFAFSSFFLFGGLFWEGACGTPLPKKRIKKKSLDSVGFDLF